MRNDRMEDHREIGPARFDPFPATWLKAELHGTPL